MPGAFPVGVVTLPFVDDSRPELSTLDATDHRTLPTTIWYPAAESARAAAKARRGDVLPRLVSGLLAAAGAPGSLIADGCGAGTRLDGGAAFAFLEDRRVHEITTSIRRPSGATTWRASPNTPGTSRPSRSRKT